MISATFIVALGWSELSSALGLILGGILAAPIGAFIVRYLPVKPLMIAVSMIIIGTAAVRLV